MPAPKIKDMQFKLIGEDELPIKSKRKSAEWLQFFKQIPEGKALVGTEKELGVGSGAIKTMVARLQQRGDLPSNFYVSQRTGADNKVTIYIVHSAKRAEKT
jgi:hypothetical protein